MAGELDGLSERGRALWVSLGREVGTADGVLALEACRAVDRLDELDRVIHGRGVVELMQFRVPHALDGDGVVTVEVKFDNVLAEARQQQGVLRQLVVSLMAMTVPADDGVAERIVRTPLDELTDRRAARGAGSSPAGHAKVARKRR